MEEVKQNKGKNKGWANLKPCKPGETHNPNGRPLGQRNFSTIYKAAMEKLAALNETTPEALEDDMIAQAVAAARKGNIQFYKDTMDRIHGTALQRHEGNFNITGVEINVRD